ncbi:MAG: NAD(P)-dependent oxidoreductase [Chloroflexi bacterium]|nr:NAD(P)-dependent oxidoreductase [Chloroflexota bacterium]
MRVLIVGGCGFLGSYLARFIMERGDQVVVQDVKTVDTPFQWVLTPEEQKQATVLEGDAVDATYVYRMLKEHRIDRIVHLARYASENAEVEPMASVRVNVEGTLVAFEAARLGLVETVVWASSTQVFGRHTPYAAEFGNQPLRDDGPHRPWSIYSATKSLCEYLGGHYHRNWGTDLRGLRPIGTFGPGRRGGLVGHITKMMYAAAVGNPYTCPNGEQALPLVYAEDSSRGFEYGLYYSGKALSGKTHTIGGYTTTHGQMAELVRKVVPDSRITVLPGDSGEPLTLPSDSSPFAEATGFQLQYSLEDGVRKTIEFFRYGSAGQA